MPWVSQYIELPVSERQDRQQVRNISIACPIYDLISRIIWSSPVMHAAIAFIKSSSSNDIHLNAEKAPVNNLGERNEVSFWKKSF